ncbi:hypothetical protein [Archangium sp.]|uniref:hypothetical protein n=1 Tax=Archangium sp. TaxID=1872627 RepID=UPI00389B0A4F
MRWLPLLTVWLLGTTGLAQVSVESHRVPSPACPWLERSDNCWAQALAEFDQCAPPQGVRGTLYVDGICRYYDGTFLHSEVVWDPPTHPQPEAFRSYELKFELLKVGKPCFSFRRKLLPSGLVDPGKKLYPKEIETEIVTRHGTVRYVESWDVERQIALWEEYQRARHPEGTEVLPTKPVKCEPGMICIKSSKPPDPRPKPLDEYAFGYKSVGFLTCPDRSMVLIGFNEYTTCDTALPVRVLRAHPEGNSLEFAFVQPQWTKKSLACGVRKEKDYPPAHFEQQVLLDAEVPEPTIPPREAGPVPDRLPIQLPSPR